jgi:acetolactate synthase-1/2/3 large subunit
MKGSEALVESLKAEGVKHMFGILGGAIMEVYDVLYDERSLRHILMRHEQAAAHAAEGYARASGKVGVCMATSGPGATNLVTGIADAHMDSTPIVALTGQVATHLIGNDAFQETDIVGITMPVTKHNFQIMSPDDIPETIKAAFMIAKSRRPGPVLVDLPKDVQQGKLSKKFAYPKAVNMEGYKPIMPEGHPKQINLAAKMLLEAKEPVILAGGGVILSGASKELYELVTSLNIPVATTLMGKGCFPEDHPLSLGMVGMHGRKAANLMLYGSDVILAVGMRFDDRVAGNVKDFTEKAKVIHVDIDSAEISKNIRADVPVVADAKLALAGINKALSKVGKRGDTEWHTKMRKFKREYAARTDYDSVPIKPQRIMKELNSLIDDKTIVTTEVGQCQMWSAHFLEIKKPRSFISSGGLGTMGSGFPYAIGAKVACPDKKVIDVGSEGSFLMNCQEMATCVKEDIPVTVLLLDNRYLGMVRQWQDIFYKGRRSNTFLGETPDFVKFAEAFGAKGIRVERPGEIREALKTAMNSGEPYIVDIPVDRNENTTPMIRPGDKLTNIID